MCVMFSLLKREECEIEGRRERKSEKGLSNYNEGSYHRLYFEKSGG